MNRVLLYTDEPVLATGFVSIMSAEPGFACVSVCGSVADLGARLGSEAPQVLLLDWTRDVTFSLLSDLQRLAPETCIVLWVRNIGTELAYQAMQLGVRGVLRKTAPPETISRCLTRVAEGELWFEKHLTASFVTAKTVALTRRESQLVNLLSQGLKNKEIAATLSISEGTVKVYFSRLFQKLGVKDRFELALYGLRNLQLSCPEPVRAEAAHERRMPAQMQRLRSLVLERPAPVTMDRVAGWNAGR